MSEQENDHAERLGKLETAFTNIAAAVNRLEQGQERIFQQLADSGKTNWSLIVAAGGLLLSFALVLWGAAIHPLSQDIARQEAGSDKLALAVIAQDIKSSKLETDIVRLSDRQAAVMETLKRFDNEGSAAADKRLTLLEYQMNHATPPIQIKTGAISP